MAWDSRYLGWKNKTKTLKCSKENENLELPLAVKNENNSFKDLQLF